MKKFILLACLILVLIGCSKKSENTPSNSIKQANTKDVTTIRNKIKPNDKSSKINFTKVREIPLADLRKTSNIPISFLTDITTANGNIFLADPRACKVIKTDSTGKFITTFCNRGGGPGELGGIDGVLIINDTIFVTDAVRTQKIAKFNLDGEFIKNFHIPKRPPKFLKRVSDNRVLGIRANMKEGGFDMVLSIYDTKNFSEVKNLSKIDVRFNNGQLSLDPTDNTPFYGAGKSHIYMSQISDYEYKFNKYDLNGNLEAVISNNYRKVEISKEEQERIQKTVKMNNQKNKMKANYRKAINGIWVDKKDRVWILASKANVDGSCKKEIYFDIFDADGNYLNTVLFDLFEADNDFILMKKIYFSGNYLYLQDAVNDRILVYDYD